MSALGRELPDSSRGRYGYYVTISSHSHGCRYHFFAQELRLTLFLRVVTDLIPKVSFPD